MRLYRRYNPERDDYVIFPEGELAQWQAQGYTYISEGRCFIGYVYPTGTATATA